MDTFMKFFDYYSDKYAIKSEIQHSTSEPIVVECWGYDIDSYISGELPITFWSSVRTDDMMESLHIKLSNPYRINNDDYDMGDMESNIRYIGIAVRDGFDSVIIESNGVMTYVPIRVDVLSAELLIEAPLSGKKISKDVHSRIAKNKKDAKAHKSLGRNMTTIKPKKAPIEGIKTNVLLSNTGKLSPDRVERAMHDVNRIPPKITKVTEVNGNKYFRAEYNFKSVDSIHRQWGYADISDDRTHCKELFCSCSDFFFRLYAPFVSAGLSTWNIPTKYRGQQQRVVRKFPHNHRWTVETNPMGKLFLCKHLWAFIAYYITGSKGNNQLSDEEIESVITDYFGNVERDTFIPREIEDEDEEDDDFNSAVGKLYTKDTKKNISTLNNDDISDKNID